MPKRATRPRYHESRGGWYVQVKGRRHQLATGSRSDPSAWTQAVLAYWKVAEVPVRDRLLAADWVRVKKLRCAEWPDPLAVRNRILGEGTAELMREWLDTLDITDEVLASAVPMPPDPWAVRPPGERADQQAERYGDWVREVCVAMIATPLRSMSKSESARTNADKSGGCRWDSGSSSSTSVFSSTFSTRRVMVCSTILCPVLIRLNKPAASVLRLSSSIRSCSSSARLSS